MTRYNMAVVKSESVHSAYPQVLKFSDTDKLLVSLHPAISEALHKRAQYMGMTVSELLEDAVELLLKEDWS